MTANGIDAKTQETIIENISSFALYGFPESHAASFALIAYASAYFKVKYLAAFTCAILNNQPMGFYMPAVLVKDAQRHGLRVKPIDVQISDWACTVEHEPDGSLSLRMGLGYAKGLRRQAAEALASSRFQDGPFHLSRGSDSACSSTQPKGIDAPGPHRRIEPTRRDRTSPRRALAGRTRWQIGRPSPSTK